MWDQADKTQAFIENNCATIGYFEQDAPALFVMLRRMQIGDMVYLKSFYGTTHRLTIKAVGIVTESAHTDETHPLGIYLENGTTRALVSVRWWAITPPCKYTVTKEDMKANVYNNTLYEEYNQTIGDTVLGLFFSSVNKA